MQQFFCLISSQESMPLLETEALFKERMETERIEVLKMTMPDVERNTVLNWFPGYCWKSLIEEPYSNNLVSGSYNVCSNALLTEVLLINFFFKKLFINTNFV